MILRFILVFLLFSLTALAALVCKRQSQPSSQDSAFIPQPIQTFVTQSQEAQQPSTLTARPIIKLPQRALSSADIHFEKFEFERLVITHHPGMLPIEGEPSKGAVYFIEPTIYGSEAIATAKFEVLDERGNVIGPVPVIKLPNPLGSLQFYGMMTVPAQTFRIALSGEAVDGQHYQRIHPRLFKPTDRPEKWGLSIPPGVSRQEARKQRAAVEGLMQREFVKVKEEFAKLPGGVIVVPKARVSNVTYAPILSPRLRPRGMRITYEVEFSETGYYNPALEVIVFYENEEWRGMVQMNVREGKIEPQPEEIGSPQVRPHALAYGADYVYRAHTVYRFTADLMPDYAIQNETKTKFCLYKQKYASSPPSARAAWNALLSSDVPTTYHIYIRNSDFVGLIENSYPQSEIYNGFAAEGALDCGVQPTSRF